MPPVFFHVLSSILLQAIPSMEVSCNLLQICEIRSGYDPYSSLSFESFQISYRPVTHTT